MKFNDNNLDILDNYDDENLKVEGEENFKYYKFLEEYLSKFSKIYKVLSKAKKKQGIHINNIANQSFVKRQLGKIYDFKFFFLITLYIAFVYYVYIFVSLFFHHSGMLYQI